jgi:hypothetical protein
MPEPILFDGSRQSVAKLPELITPAQATRLLGLTNEGTLSVWRSNRRFEKALPHVKIGRSVRYKLQDVLHFIEQRTIGGETHE